MTRWIVIAALWASPVAAQEEPDAQEPDAQEPAVQEPAAAEPGLPRVLIVPEPRTPRSLVVQVSEILDSVGERVDSDAYVREARARGLPPDSEEAFDQLLGEQNVALVVVVGRSARRDSVHLIYREGRLGFALLEEDHPLAGREIPAEQANRILAEARLALAAVTRPTGGGPAPEPVPMDRAPRAPRRRTQAGTAVHVGVTGGLGAGTRSFEIDTDAGLVRLGTSVFPAAVLALRVQIEPEARGRLELEGALRYLTSVGLRTTDQRSDLETASRAQRLELQGIARYRLGETATSVSLEAAIGWALRTFSNETPVSLPDYALGGPTAGAAMTLPLLDGKLRLVLGPEVHLVLSVGDELSGAGAGTPGFALGIEAGAHYTLSGTLSVAALYRESHATMPTEMNGTASDIERFAALTVSYQP